MHFFIAALFLFSFKANALIGFEDAVFPELATSGRALAMGNAFLNKVDDSSSVFYNPAGLGTVRYSHFHLSNFHIETNKGWIKNGTGGEIEKIATDFPKSFSLDGQRELLLNNKGVMMHSRFHVMPNITTRFFSVGYLLSQRTRATIDKDADALFEYADRRDHGPYAGLNLSLFGGVLKFGGSAIYLQRKEAIGEQNALQKIDLQDSDYRKGRAVIITGGSRLTLPITFLPTFSAVIHNATGKRFTESGAGAPYPIHRTIDVGFSITPQIGQTTRLHLEVNYKDVTDIYSDVDTSRKLLLGAEFDLARTMFVRFGYGDAFGSAGLGIRTRKLEFDLTTYAVDGTGSSFRGSEDRRFALTISSGF